MNRNDESDVVVVCFQGGVETEEEVRGGAGETGGGLFRRGGDAEGVE